MSFAFVVLTIFAPVIIGIVMLPFYGRWRNSRIGEPPVKEYMLRPAGESSRRLIDAYNEEVLEDIFVVAVIPIACAGVYFYHEAIQGGVSGHNWWLFPLLSMSALCWKGRILVRRLKELRNRQLGYAGEQLVAERLAPPARHGYLIFHDCPADVHGNIDHIVVTPS